MVKTIEVDGDMFLSKDKTLGYIYSNQKIKIYDLNNPINPQLKNAIQLEDNFYASLLDISTDNTKLYAINNKAQLNIYDISDLENIEKLSSYDLIDNKNVKDIKISPDGKKAYIGSRDSLQILDVSDARSPLLIGYLKGIGVKFNNKLVISPDGNTLYLKASRYIHAIDIREDSEKED